jgi:small-conductance mechanosensitive channel
LFVKHPYDVGDRITIDDKDYTVAKMQLLSSNFKRGDGKFVWIGHNVLATKVIENSEFSRGSMAHVKLTRSPTIGPYV